MLDLPDKRRWFVIFLEVLCFSQVSFQRRDFFAFNQEKMQRCAQLLRQLSDHSPVIGVCFDVALT